MADVQWTPVEAVSKKVAKKMAGGRITLEFRLNQAPDIEWEKGRQVTGTGRSGPMEYVMGPEPRVVGDLITWDIPEQAMADAVSYVNRSIEAANQRYRGVLARRQAEKEKRAEKEAKDQASIEELQRKLDEL